MKECYEMEQINTPVLGAPYVSFSQTGLSSIQVKAKLDQFGENTFSLSIH